LVLVGPETGGGGGVRLRNGGFHGPDQGWSKNGNLEDNVITIEEINAMVCSRLIIYCFD
jgi:hypothetical protein